jgi:hypothetical protein
MSEHEEHSMSTLRRERHAFDLFSLIAGILFLGVGLVFVLEEASSDGSVDAGWVLAALLIGLGLAGALGSLVRPRRNGDTTEPEREEVVE